MFRFFDRAGAQTRFDERLFPPNEIIVGKLISLRRAQSCFSSQSCL
jgi:hypothetical protein